MTAATITDQQLDSWYLSGHAYKRIAVLIARWARVQERGTALPGDEFFAEQLDRVASDSTYRRAKTLLADQGVLYASSGPYMVA